MSELLNSFITSLPLAEPTRVTASGSETIAEWQVAGKYYEASEEDGNIEVMFNDGDKFRHWKVLKLLVKRYPKMAVFA